MTETSLYVTRPELPPVEDLLPYLREIWESRILTNGGPIHARFEAALCEYLGVDHISLFTNGTIALITALQALGVSGEVITTPYSFVATTHALAWNGIEPVFADIGPNGFNLDPASIDRAITPRTTAILPVHCYGVPCDVEAIQSIADAHGLRVIYDAAHAFGVRHPRANLLRAGDLSILSFHATKVFNSFEGGAIICPDVDTKRRIDQLRNFGFVDETTIISSGINGKMSEIHAAIGLLQLNHVDDNIDRRNAIDALYRRGLQRIDGIECLDIPSGGSHNFGYFPILVQESYSVSRDDLHDILKRRDIYGRRYFYPLISDLPMYRDLDSASPSNLPMAADRAAKVICLPIYPGLDPADVERVIGVIREAA